MSNLALHYVMQYGSNIKLALQQKNSRLDGKVGSGMHKGTEASPVDFVGTIEMDEITGRNEPKVSKDPGVDRRWVAPTAYDLNQIVGELDQAQMLADPKNSRVEAAVAAAKRQRDRIIISSFFASSITGNKADATTAFPSANQVAVNFGSASNSSMTVAKLLEARRLLESYNVEFDAEDVYVGITSKEADSLRKEAQLQSKDFTDKPVLVNGTITELMGFKFVQSELFALDASSYRRCPVWCKSGMYIGDWIDLKTNISQRNDLKDEPWQAYLKMYAGATRLEENKVIEIKCA